MSHLTLDGGTTAEKKSYRRVVSSIAKERAKFALNHANANHFVPIYRIYRIFPCNAPRLS